MSELRCFIQRHPMGYDGLSIDFQRYENGFIEHAHVSPPNDMGGATLLWTPKDRDRDGYEFVPTLRLDFREAEAFLAEIDKRKAPEAESVALREALEVERSRVNKFIDVTLRPTVASL